ncbi:hypothetical protein [Streptomyces caelestis]|jgi:hypothetical protein|uniref:Uncharacterized protein n=1 Tax=Streptomyces caelestis TaxID=36816 RepID=A0A7W9LQ49_9ACTN|nr:hypothetical protein [Streptomyces caelestis]MBB5792118.1 hypothetical protein [Streptomyces caelestis]
MAVHRDDVEVDWLHRQVLTSRNIYSSRFTDFMVSVSTRARISEVVREMERARA